MNISLKKEKEKNNNEDRRGSKQYRKCVQIELNVVITHCRRIGRRKNYKKPKQKWK